MSDPSDALAKNTRRLRLARGLSLETLGARAGLAADTIRRLEQKKFSPSLRTVTKVAAGLEVAVVVLLEAPMSEEHDDERAKLLERLRGRAAWEIAAVGRIVEVVLDLLDELGDGP